MSDNKYKELMKRAATYILSTACGAGAAIALLLLFALIMNLLGVPPVIAGLCALLSFGAGCFVSGLICGGIKKKNGLRHGFRCAVIMAVLVMTGAAICGNFSGTDAVAKTVTAVIAGCFGGVLGVNRKADI